MSAKVLGLDPGKTTGYAYIQVEDDRSIKLLNFGETKDQDLIDIAEFLQEADYVVYEDWTTRPGHNFTGSKMPAARVIGSARTLFRLAGKDVACLKSQQAAQKVPGYGLAGMKYQPGKKGVHIQDALAHAVVFSVGKLAAKPLGRKLI